MGVLEVCGLGIILSSIHTPVSHYIKQKIFDLVVRIHAKGGFS